MSSKRPHLPASYKLSTDADLRDFQKRGVHKLIKFIESASSRSTLLGSEMGTGKTIQAIRVCDILGSRKILICCPSSAKGVWEPELRKFSLFKDREFFCVNSGTDILPENHQVVVIGYGLVWSKSILRQVMSKSWDIIICDEAHHLSNIEAKRSKVCLGNFYNFKTSNPYHLFLTGSVQRNKIIDLHPTFYRCRPDLFDADRMQFARKYCHVFIDKFKRVHIKGGKNLDALNALCSQFMVRHTKEEATKELLPKIETTCYLNIPGVSGDLTPDEAAKIAFAAEKKDSLYQPYKQLGKMTKERGELGLLKVKYVVDWIRSWRKESCNNEKEPFVLFCLHREVFAQYKELLTETFPDEKISTIIGNDKKTDRDKAVSDFQSGKSSIFLCTFAASEAITLVKARIMFISELSWSMSLNEQALDRIHRIGQTRQVEIFYLLADCKIDRMMLASYQSKKKYKKKVVG